MVVDHEWYEEDFMLSWNNHTFLKSWETIGNDTEVSLVCFVILLSV